MLRHDLLSIDWFLFWTSRWKRCCLWHRPLLTYGVHGQQKDEEGCPRQKGVSIPWHSWADPPQHRLRPPSVPLWLLLLLAFDAAGHAWDIPCDAAWGSYGYCHGSAASSGFPGKLVYICQVSSFSLPPISFMPVLIMALVLQLTLSSDSCVTSLLDAVNVL